MSAYWKNKVNSEGGGRVVNKFHVNNNTQIMIVKGVGRMLVVIILCMILFNDEF